MGNQTMPLNIALHFGGLHIGCNQSDATYQLQTPDGQFVSEGILPATINGLPPVDYKLMATHHGHQRTDTLAVRPDAMTSAQSDFQYGTVVVATYPAGVVVASDNQPNWGATPLTLSEMWPGNWTFTLKRNGYQPVQVTVKVEANQTSYISTNLISETYFHAMSVARQFMATADYDLALQAANDALAAKADDVEATSLQREATGLGMIQHAEKMGQQGDYLGGGKELQGALEFLPDNVEAKQLIAEFKQHEPEQIDDYGWNDWRSRRKLLTPSCQAGAKRHYLKAMN